MNQKEENLTENHTTSLFQKSIYKTNKENSSLFTIAFCIKVKTKVEPQDYAQKLNCTLMNSICLYMYICVTFSTQKIKHAIWCWNRFISP
jgi:hypothetical protein